MTVFSKTYCPYCSATKKLLHSLGSEDELDIRINIVELDEMETHDAANVKSHLFDMTGQMTFPNVFFGETHIGGNDNAQELARSGLLKRMLEKIASSRDEF